MVAPSQADPELKPVGPMTLYVVIDGVTHGFYESVEGLGSESKIIEDANGSGIAHPGQLVASRLVLKRVFDPRMTGLWNWRRSVMEGRPMKRDGRLIFYDAEGYEVACWAFKRGWPSRWEVPALVSASDKPGMELVEIVHEGLTLEED